eukprot:CAMPEP_0184395738 /NCGR_PEP_ID=MMETSP0007-20130409/45840_1 /TAXON_ID=97485 /ORGANISM="Prymnesium parvum, Strain Texoma1" /LENGTH=112 /DNA_ID=CAMNT_0026748119 /DNA_START=23 /DNA_END=361 /DNA_ORIENTATION=-
MAPQLIWASGRVVRIADGLTNTRSSRARKILPGGAVLWAWEADPDHGEAAGEQWLVLLPSKWNRTVHYGWRYDPAELGSCSAASPARPVEGRGSRRSPVVDYACEDDSDGAN